MPKFLTRTEIFRLLQRELPPGVYPDGDEDSSYSTADMASVAAVAASAYANLERIYENYWPQTAVENIADWEFAAFGSVKNAGLTIEERQDRVTQQIRTRKGLTPKDMKDTVLSVIGTDKDVEIAEHGQSTGGWMLGESQLGISTILNLTDLLRATGENIDSMDPSDFGLTEEEWLEMRKDAYTYEVLIYDYTLTEEERAEIEAKLDIAEPGRSNRIITDGLDSADKLELDDE